MVNENLSNGGTRAREWSGAKRLGPLSGPQIPISDDMHIAILGHTSSSVSLIAVCGTL